MTASKHSQDSGWVGELALCANSPTLAIAANKLDIYQILCVKYSTPDDGRRNRLKHVEHWQQQRILYNVASCWLDLKEYINDAGYHERQTDSYLFNCSTNYLVLCNIIRNVNQRQDVQLHHVSIITLVWRHTHVFLEVASQSSTRRLQRWYKLISYIRNESCLKRVVAYWDRIFGSVIRE